MRTTLSPLLCLMVESCALDKFDLLSILTKDIQNDPPDFVDVKLLDGAAVVHFLHTVNVATFDQYVDQVFLPYVMKQLENSRRVDIVWDRYIPTSIKESTREKRGKGTRRGLQVTTSYQETGLTSYVIPPTNRNCLHFFPARLPM